MNKYKTVVKLNTPVHTKHQLYWYVYIPQNLFISNQESKNLSIKQQLQFNDIVVLQVVWWLHVSYSRTSLW
jgi:hypothetical protein